jgi:hypothetical protein
MASEKNIKKVEERVAKLQSDTSLDWARKPRVQATLAIATAIASLATPAAFLFGTIPGVLAAAVMFAGYFLLRGATREIAELPSRYLDERELAVRNATYVGAYQLLAGLIGLLAIVVFVFAVGADASDSEVALTLTFEQLQAIVWLFLGPISVIPTMSLALRRKK